MRDPQIWWRATEDDTQHWPRVSGGACTVFMKIQTHHIDLKKKKTETKQNVRLENLDDRDLHIPDPTVRLGVLKGFLTNL